MACDGLRSVFRFFALAVVRDMRVAITEGRAEISMVSRPGEQRRSLSRSSDVERQRRCGRAGGIGGDRRIGIRLCHGRNARYDGEVRDSNRR